ncbi:hypothetical protein [Coleofasciculus sp. F4-SAH-05]|uniref:hypothetical protein n=1 Tax=Coleofasciculus sp. F4-SAH-05 TaxID=3069525 RepID=UPI0032F86974
MSINRTIERAIRFLLLFQHDDGWWADFQLAPGPSNIWVTAYIGWVLAGQDHPQARDAAALAWHWLSAQQSPGWGYNPLTPQDADSTLWALQLAAAVGARGRGDGGTRGWGDSSEAGGEKVIPLNPTWYQTRVEQGYRFLQQHRQPGGGVATYAQDQEIRAFIGASPSVSFQGWCQPHVCVTAAAAGIDELTADACEFLRANQSADGCWHSYWWCEDEYATSLAVLGLQKQDHPEDRERIDRAVQWGLTRITAQGWVPSTLYRYGSPFATAWVISLLSTRKQLQVVRDAMERAWQWLKGQQKPNGSWLGSACLRVPPPDWRNPETYNRWKLGRKIEGGISLDQNSLFTTATAIAALSHWKTQIG